MEGPGGTAAQLTRRRPPTASVASQSRLQQREQGDGAPVLESSFDPFLQSPSIDEGQGSRSEFGRMVSKPFTVRVEVDIMQILLTVASLVSRTWQLGLPRAVVFDELHFAKFEAMLVLRGTSNLKESGLSFLHNALLVQSRFMLMEGMLIFFSSLAVMAFLKFRNLGHRSFSVAWWFWLCLTGVAFTCSLSVKYSGVFTGLLILYLTTKDYWAMLDDIRISDMSLVKHLFSRLVMLMWVPVAVYLAIFYIHLTVLTKAGPHDNIMTSAFQASLEGGLAALTKGQPLNVAYGSQITLRHTANVGGSPCWLHSHAHVYPMRYPDSRGSSHQQQVTCYIFKDVNNWWIIKHPDRNSLVVDETPTYVRHGDIVQLVHGITTRALNSHDVAAPVTPQNQEVSCYVDYNVSMPAQNLWRVDIVNRQSDHDTWQTIQSQITGKQLPEWGFHQLEVTADRLINQRDTVWNVEEHRYSKSQGKEGQVADVEDADLLPLEPTHLSFWAKMWELQSKMFLSKQDTELEHKYSSQPTEWPFMARNIAYWMSSSNNAQIHLLGNVVVWYSSSIAILCYLLLGVFYFLRRQRAVLDITESEWQHFVFVGELAVGGYLLHYLPFLAADRTLFLHHYLPAVIFKILALTALLDHLALQHWRFVPVSAIVTYGTVVLISGAVYTFLELLPVTFGNVDLTPEDIQKLTWRDTWDFLQHTRV
ncbi:hypothetical protein BaRGS_00011712 [Batillaria attramentaria]|uniref:dolichyl-phosphate-mannose--protein mannosyltransferase n=1 Tax=Batillaria attramentaria TaxID=370345 RepID=A0ABD0LBL5_9CAEN